MLVHQTRNYQSQLATQLLRLKQLLSQFIEKIFAHLDRVCAVKFVLGAIKYRVDEFGDRDELLEMVISGCVGNLQEVKPRLLVSSEGSLQQACDQSRHLVFSFTAD